MYFYMTDEYLVIGSETGPDILIPLKDLAKSLKPYLDEIKTQ